MTVAIGPRQCEPAERPQHGEHHERRHAGVVREGEADERREDEHRERAVALTSPTAVAGLDP